MLTVSVSMIIHLFSIFVSMEVCHCISEYAVEDMHKYQETLSVPRPIVIENEEQLVVFLDTAPHGSYQAFITGNGIENYRSISITSEETKSGWMRVALDLNELLGSLKGPNCRFIITRHSHQPKSRVPVKMERTASFNLLDVINQHWKDTRGTQSSWFPAIEWVSSGMSNKDKDDAYQEYLRKIRNTYP